MSRPRTAPRTSLDEAGFTLLEILVALVVLGLLMAGLAGGTRLGLAGWHAQDRQLAAADGLEPVDRALGRLIEAAEAGSPDGRGFLTGEAGRLAFIAPAALLGRQTEVIDRLDIAIGLERGQDRHGPGRLVLRSAPHFHARPLHPLPPGAQAPGTQSTVLLDGVRSIAFSYLDRNDHRWHDEWTANMLPALIRLHVIRAGGSGENGSMDWPDMVWAPMRERGE